MVVNLTDENIYHDEDDDLLELGDLAILSSELLERLKDFFIDGPIIDNMEKVERRLQLELQQYQLEGYMDDPEDDSLFSEI